METLLQPARELLEGISLADFLSARPPRTVLSISPLESVGGVLRRFAAAGLVAAPLFADEERTCYRGRFFDLMDVVAAVVAAARQPTASCGSGHPMRHRAAEAARRLAEQPVASIRLAADDAQAVLPTQLSATLLEVVREGFADPVDKLACHHLAVLQPSSSSGISPAGPGGDDADLAAMEEDFGGSGIGSTAGSSWLGQLTITHIVSQSDILRFLHTHRQRLGQALLGSSLAQLGFGEKRVQCVTADWAVIDALAGMVEGKVPALAVMDSLESGRLVGNLSMSDLRGILPAHFEQLAEPVGEFLAGGGWRDSPRGWGGAPATPAGGLAAEFGIRSPEALPHAPALLACTLRSTFGEVLERLVEGRIHRLFVTDAAGQPAGVVSATDILRLIAGASGSTTGAGPGQRSRQQRSHGPWQPI